MFASAGRKKRVFGASAQSLEGDLRFERRWFVFVRPVAQHFHGSSASRVARTLPSIVLADTTSQIIGDAAVERAVLAQQHIQAPRFDGFGLGCGLFLFRHL